MNETKKAIQKADIALSDLTGSGGYLNTEQSNTFYRKLLDAPTIIGQTRSVQMNSPKREVNKVGFGSRILKVASQAAIGEPPGVGRSLAAADRSKPDLSKITLDTKEVMAEVNIPYEVLEDNIERDNFEDTIMSMIAERAALDLEELLILGDTSTGSADPYLDLLDGAIVQATSNVVDNTNNPVSKDMFATALKTMPTQFLRNRSQFRFFTSVAQEINYRNLLADRQTGLGDTLITGAAPVYAFGVPIQSAALMPDTDILLLIPQNMLFGIQRQIRVETDKDIRGRYYIIVLTARIDFLYEEEISVVKIENIA